MSRNTAASHTRGNAARSLRTSGRSALSATTPSPCGSDRGHRRERRPSGVLKLKAREGDRLDAHCADMTIWMVAGGASPSASLSM